MQAIGQIAIVLYIIFIPICYFICQHDINKHRAETFMRLEEYTKQLEDYNRRMQEEIEELKNKLNRL